MKAKGTLPIKIIPLDFQAALVEAHKIGKAEGRREVVDYFFYDAGIVALMGCRTMDECKAKLPNWQAKLKEWEAVK